MKRNLFLQPVFVVLLAALAISFGVKSAKSDGVIADHAHRHDRSPLVMDASYFGQDSMLEFHHTHFNQDKAFSSASASFNEFCRDRIDGKVPHKDYRELFHRIGSVVGYFEGQGYSDIKVNVVSCFRSAKSNGIIRTNSLKRNGGSTGVAKRSQHTYGTAMDFFLTSNDKMISIPETIDFMCAQARQRGGGGVGKYAGWVHADTRDYLAQWGGANCRSGAVNALMHGM